MAKGNPMTEFRNFDLPQVTKLVSESRIELRQLQGRAAAQDLKNVRAIREIRLKLARLLTRRQELAASPR